MTFEQADLKKSKKQILKEFEDYRVKNGNLSRLVGIMNKNYPGSFRNFYSSNNDVSASDHITPNESNLHNLPLEFRGKVGCLTLTIPNKTLCGSYFETEYYQLITGWNYLIDFPRKKMQDAPKSVLNEFCKRLVSWQNNYHDKEVADKLWLDFEKFCVEKLGANIVH